ncbi:helix-turn-helix transcriptional regulator [Paraflavitalea speifideaquila]|uniref:helix-turn-helix domain-containing protein n=1 Tax=Paraflavitalea speifideaquila TaxID=3076558 RepID=UPI0028E5259F|nr:helix-turn-helix transcriptional regulator [Paraflavitalea speifideiaquila]
MSQQDFAAIIGVSRSFISDVEGVNRPAKYNVRHVNALADYFGMSPREFFPKKPSRLMG